MENIKLSTEAVLAASQSHKEKNYWLKKISHNFELSTFPPDNHIKGAGIHETVNYHFSNEVVDKLIAISKDSDRALHVILTATLKLLLKKYTGNKDVIIGTPVYKESLTNKGELINTTLPLQTYIDLETTFKDLLLLVRQNVLEAIEFHRFPMEVLAEQLNVSKLFDCAIMLENVQDIQHFKDMQANMKFFFSRQGSDVTANITYHAEVYERSTVENISRQFQYLLEEVLFSKMDKKMNSVSIITDEEYDQLFIKFNDTKVEYPETQTIQELFEEQVVQTPTHIAIKCDDTILNYEEVNIRVNQLARQLKLNGLKANDQVVLFTENSVDTIIGILGILKSGAIYVPLDVNTPIKRQKFILEEIQPKMTLVTSNSIKKLYKDRDWLPHMRVIALDNTELYKGDGSNVPIAANLEDLAYIIYTSGTTGNPKGVMVSQRNLVNYLSWAEKMYVGYEQLHFPLFTSIAFDLTITSIFLPLLTGNAVLIYKSENNEVPLERIIDDNQVGVIKLTPSHLKLLKHRRFNQTNLKRLIVGGEQLPSQLAREILSNFNNKIEIYNEYGPTEATVGCMVHKYSADDKYRMVPIGKPGDNTQIYVLDESLKPVPKGVLGEIYIGGAGVTSGYFEQPEMTEKSFLPNPLIPKSRMYKTGDYARFLNDGNLQYVGRKDNQIKVNGYRIELEEIQSKLLEFKEKDSPEEIHFEDISNKEEKEVQFCTRCVISSNHPKVEFDEQGVCSVCREYDSYSEYTDKYFKRIEDFQNIVSNNQGKDYDCLVLFSGGKDSTYVLYRLIEMGMRVLTFTFNNGFISEQAIQNIKNTTKRLGVDNITLDSSNMDKVFVKSLKTYSNVCNGCWNAINGLGTELARQKGIKVIVSGLSRGQIFDMRLWGLYQLGIFDEKEIEERLLLFRKGFHSKENLFTKTLEVELEEEVIEDIHYVDFFRYDDTPTIQIKEYLLSKGWIQPKDTGICSSNCKINDIGIYMHLMNEGFHNYAAPTSWDVRFGIISREEAMREISYTPNAPNVKNVLSDIGYFKSGSIEDAIIVTRQEADGTSKICAYFVSDSDLDTQEIKKYLASELPEYMVPTYIMQVSKINLTENGKVDERSLPLPQKESASSRIIRIAPENEIESILCRIWASILMRDEEEISIHDRFFEIGGDSFKMVQANLKVNEMFNHNIPITTMYRYPTIRTLADYLAGEKENNQIMEVSNEQIVMMNNTLMLLGEEANE